MSERAPTVREGVHGRTSPDRQGGDITSRTLTTPIVRKRMPPMENAKHSGLGIASFCVSLLTALGIFATIAVASVMELSTPGGMDEDAPSTVIVGLIIIAGILIAFGSAIAGLASCFQRDRLKIFGILGAGIGGLAALATLGLIVIGLTMP